MQKFKAWIRVNVENIQGEEIEGDRYGDMDDWGAVSYHRMIASKLYDKLSGHGVEYEEDNIEHGWFHVEINSAYYATFDVNDWQWIGLREPVKEK